jgi:Polyketide cyclase / dehydrase and lipid transport
MAALSEEGQGDGMDLHSEHPVAAPEAAAWAVVGEQFGRISETLVAILDSRLDGPLAPGTSRTCRTAAFGPVPSGEIVERLTVFDPQRRRLEYEATGGMPSFVTAAVNRWSVHPATYGTSLLRVHATLTLKPWARPLGPLLRLRLRSASRQALEELTHRIETGRPHPRKAAAVPP